MKVVKQVKPFKPNDVFMLRVWKKRVFIEGWYAQLQIGKRAWGVFPGDRARKKQVAQHQANWKDRHAHRS